MINKNIARKVLTLGLSTGADFAELYFEDAYKHSITFDSGVVDSIGSNSSSGVGIRLLKENRSVYGYTNDLSEKNLLELTKKLASAFNDKVIATCQEFKNKKVKNINRNDDSYFLTPTNDKVVVLKKVYDVIKNYSPLITRSAAMFVGDKKSFEIYNSEGLHIKDKSEHSRLVIQAFAKKEDRQEIAFAAYGTSDHMDYFKSLDLDKIGNNVAKKAIEALDAVDCPSGRMPVVIGNGNGGVLFHEACGHGLEACAVSRNLSVFTNRIGEQVASPLVNAYDDGTIKGAWGTINVDDEGHASTRNCLIKNGILTNYIVDRFYGRKMNKEATGSCRRQNYKFEPTTRMTNTFIDNGTSTPEEIIKATKLGLYAEQLGGGSVSTVTGQFEFNCTVAYIIRDGKIAERVKGATLIGTGEEILKNIDMIGNDLSLDCGFCGANSGSIPVATGQPTLRVKEILIGGNGGKIV